MRRLPWLGLALLLPLVACDSTGPDSEEIVGAYVLASVDGNVLPWTAGQSGADRVRVLNGDITLAGDGTFTDRTTWEITLAGVVTQEDDVYLGSFLGISKGATLTYDDFGPQDVEIADGKLTQIISEATWVYRR